MNPYGDVATPGTYGQPPRGYRLPDAVRLGEVHLRVADLDRSIDYYTTVLGMRVIGRDGARAVMGAHGDDRALLDLHERPGARPVPTRARLGLFHFAILLPDRASLGRFATHLSDLGLRAGAADHLVSESFYLQDPDNLGIEVYADKPRDTWRRNDRELMMATDPLDIASLVRGAAGTPWTGMPAGTVMGHVHLHVGDLARASAFYSEALGLDRMVWSYPGALFLAGGGYHHHLGTNVWAGPTATPASDDEAGLIEWIIDLPDAASVAAAASSVAGAGFSVTPDEADALTADPWGTRVRLRQANR